MSLKRSARMWAVWAIGAAVGWGLWGFTSSLAARHGTSLGLLAGALLIEALCVLPLVRSVPGSMSWSLVAAGVFGAVGFGCFYVALKSGGPPSAVVAITALYPALMFVLSAIILSESVSVTKVIGVAMAVGAIVLLSTTT